MEQPIPFDQLPAPRSWPLVGHLPYLLTRGGVIQQLSAGARRFPDGVFRIEAPQLDLAVVSRARIAAELFDTTRFDKDVEGPLRLLRPIAGDGLFTADTEEESWALAHRILVPAFTRDAMQRYFPAMQETLDGLLHKWDGSIARGESVDVRDDMTRLTLDTISLTGFGYRFRSFERPQLHPFLGAMGTVLVDTMEQLRRPKALHALMVHKHRAVRLATAEMNTLVDSVIAERHARGAAGADGADGAKDLLDLMLTARDERGRGLSNENIRYQILTFLIAGHETTSNLLSFALRALYRDPALLARATAEADAVLGDRPTFSDVGKLDLVRRVLFEALRLWPPAPALGFHPLREPQLLAGKFQIPLGTRVIVLLPALHRDPEVWDDPERFDPDRFLPENEAKRPAAAYKPFGNGKRICIGRQFALVEAELALATILRRYRMVQLDGDDAVEENLTLKPSRYTLRLERRTPGHVTASSSTAVRQDQVTRGGCPFHVPTRA